MSLRREDELCVAIVLSYFLSSITTLAELARKCRYRCQPTQVSMK